MTLVIPSAVLVMIGMGLLISLQVGAAFWMGFWMGRYGPRRNWTEDTWIKLLGAADALKPHSLTENFIEEVDYIKYLTRFLIQPDMTAYDVGKVQRHIEFFLSQLNDQVEREKEIAIQLAFNVDDILEDKHEDDL